MKWYGKINEFPPGTINIYKASSIQDAWLAAVASSLPMGVVITQEIINNSRGAIRVKEMEEIR